MADRTPPWTDRTAEVPPPRSAPDATWPAAGTPWQDPAANWPAQGPSWPDRGPSWPDSGPSWPDPGPGDPAAGRGPAGPAFHRGVAPVSQRGPGRQHPGPDETLTDGPGWRGHPPVGQPRPPVRYRMRQLRRGGEWTTVGALFAFICWGIWAVSVRGGDLVVPVLAFVLVLLVAIGVFALARLVGKIVIERTMQRTRRSAWVAHMVTGLFLLGAGVAYLRQTQWVVDAWTWVRGFI
jgi:hypothetical protein